MSNKSIHYITQATPLVSPAVSKATVTSTSFDREKGPTSDIGAPYEALELLLDIGAYTDGNHSWVMNESSDNSTWTAVAQANMLGAGIGASGACFAAVNASAGQNKVQRVAYVGTLRYVQVVSTETGATGLLWGLIAVPGYPRNLPDVASGS